MNSHYQAHASMSDMAEVYRFAKDCIDIYKDNAEQHAGECIATLSANADFDNVATWCLVRTAIQQLRRGLPDRTRPYRPVSFIDAGFDSAPSYEAAPRTRRMALVTGGTRGIGRAISLALKKTGYRVAATYSENDQAARTFTAETGIPNYKFDVSDPKACQTSVERITGDMGPIDVLVNNAGITRDGTMHKMDAAQWQTVIDTNLGGCFHMCRAVIDSMRKRGFGRIVNVGSINGQAGQYGQVNYAAAKSGIHGFTKALAQEGAGKGVTVNAIAPGYVDTDMVRAVAPPVLEKIIGRIPVGRIGHAEDIARGVVFLVADEADFITGSTLSINGGQQMY